MNFFTDMPQKLSIHLFKSHSSKDLYQIASMPLTSREDSKRQAALIALFSRHASLDDILYQQAFMQQPSNLTLFSHPSLSNEFYSLLMESMCSVHSNFTHKLWGILFVARLKNISLPDISDEKLKNLELFHDPLILNWIATFLKPGQIDKIFADIHKRLSYKNTSDQDIGRALNIFIGLIPRLPKQSISSMITPLLRIINQDRDTSTQCLEALNAYHFAFTQKEIQKITPNLLKYLGTEKNSDFYLAADLYAKICLPTLSEKSLKLVYTEALKELTNPNCDDKIQNLGILKAYLSLKTIPSIAQTIFPTILFLLNDTDNNVRERAIRTCIPCLPQLKDEEILGALEQIMDVAIEDDILVFILEPLALALSQTHVNPAPLLMEYITSEAKLLLDRVNALKNKTRHGAHITSSETPAYLLAQHADPINILSYRMLTNDTEHSADGPMTSALKSHCSLPDFCFKHLEKLWHTINDCSNENSPLMNP